jgi:two-component system cell cycle sensor histidine kinase/response regulator CckA
LVPISDWLRRAVLIVVSAGLVVTLAFWYFAIKAPPIPHRTLRIGFEPNPPVQLRTASGFGGLAVETINEAARRAGITLEWVETGSGSDDAFARGLVDLWPLMADLPERRKRIHFTKPWLYTNQILVLRSESPVPDRKFDGRIGVFQLALQARLAKGKYPGAQVVPFPDAQEILKAVCKGTVDAAFVLDRAGLAALGERPAECESTALRIEVVPDLTLRLGTASTFESAGAADRLRDEIDNLFQDGTLAFTMAKYSYYGLDDTWTTYNLLESAERTRWVIWGLIAFVIAVAVTALQATYLRDRKRSEAALRVSEERFRAIFHQAAVGVAQVTLDGEVTMVNDRYCDVLGHTRDELLGKELLVNTYPEDCAAVLAYRRQLLAGEIPSYSLETRSVREDGSIAWIKSYESLVRDGASPAKYSIAVVEDVTQAKWAQAALQESEKRFRNLADTAPAMIWVTGRDKLATFFNSGWLNFTGSTLKESLGNGWGSKVHPDDREGCFTNYGLAFDARAPYLRESRMRRADGEYRWMLVTGAPRYESNGEFAGYVGACTDITELKRTQEEALAMQKMETVGVLARGIAHDFNNLLGGIVAQAELAVTELEQGESPIDGIQRIRAVAWRGAEIVRELMIYSGQDDATDPFEPVDLSRLVGEMLELLKISVSKHAALKSELHPGALPVQCRPSQIRQIVMNLIINASEAIGQNDGVIKVTTSHAVLPRESSTSGASNLPPGDYAILEVSDTGCGITEEMQAKVFDPFFSTKLAGRGLGLAVVQGIVRDHGGTINLISAPGEGTTFEIFLPCSERAESHQGAIVRPSGREEPPASGTVLVVEDEEILRLAVSNMLRRNGFEVIEAVDGHSAIELIRTHHSKIDVMLLDMTLPGMSSREVFEEALHLRPDLNAILTSAYSRETVDASFAGLRVERFIRKPFQFEDLIGVLQDALSK